jgi:pyrimidine-nucleoside phosphorylase
MNPVEIIARKRDGHALSVGEIHHMIRGFAVGDVADAQMSALAMAILLNGMSTEETLDLTQAMLLSGQTLEWPNDGIPRVDKHSTGGIGDKISLILAPLLACCDLQVPMISGRGLGPTGGTLDKLESIPGLRTSLETSAIDAQVREVGCVIAGQTETLVPADRRLYALRDVTGLIESVPLIASSILSKKLAEGLDALVLDVKFGSGAFLCEPERGAELARTMLALANETGLSACAFQTAMDRPLGRAAGNALEVAESVACLAGGGPPDLRELVCVQGGALLALCGLASDADAGARCVAKALDDGTARERFVRMVEAQGGDPRAVEDTELLPRAPDEEVLTADADGVVAWSDVRALGRAVGALGGGREALEDAIDPAVGIVFERDVGEPVHAGEPIARLHHRAGRGLALARDLVRGALDLTSGRAAAPLVLARLDQETSDPSGGETR